MSHVFRFVKGYLRVVHRTLNGKPWPNREPHWVRSDFLVAQPSALTGIARIVDMGATLDTYNISATPAEADARALYADWRVIGQDLITVVEHHRRRTEPAHNERVAAQ